MSTTTPTQASAAGAVVSPSETPSGPTMPSAPSCHVGRVEGLAVAALFVAAMAFLAAIFAVALAARAVDEHRAVAAAIQAGGMPGGTAVRVSLDDFAISPDPLTVPAGGRLLVTNEGAVEHNLSVEGHATPMLAGGDSAELDLAGLAPGAYVVVCDVPGHEAAGMSAALVVS